MEQALQQQAALSIKGIALPSYDEIPNVGLYLEQVTKYLNDYLEPLGCSLLTRSMISNYVKKGLVDNPVRKQYDRDQIAWLMVIAIGKTVLSLEDVQLLIRLQKHSRDTGTAYNEFCEFFLRTMTAVFHGGPIEQCEPDSSDFQLLFRSSIVAVAHKLYLDRCFAILQQKDK